MLYQLQASARAPSFNNLIAVRESEGVFHREGGHGQQQQEVPEQRPFDEAHRAVAAFGGNLEPVAAPPERAR